MEKTLCIIKPDAVKNSFVEDINKSIKSNGLKIINSKRIQLSKKIAEDFYSEHAERPFFPELVEFMTSDFSVVQILQGEDAISTYRKLMGATNPEEAEEGTLRARFAESLSKNLSLIHI